MAELLTALLLFSVLCPLTSLSQWSGFPVTNGDWNLTRTNNDPFAQIWAAGVERQQVVGSPAWGPGISLWAYGAPYVLDWTQDVVMVGGITYTNWLPVWTNANLALNWWNFTNLVITTNVVISPVHGVHSNATVCAHLERGLALEYCFDGLFDALRYYVLTNETTNAAGTLFNDWFARTNSGGSHPTTFPAYRADGSHWDYADPSRLFNVTLGTNYGMLGATDAWGVVHGYVHWGYLYECAFQARSNCSALLAESALTNRVSWTNGVATTNWAWDFRSVSSLNMGDFGLPYWRLNEQPVVTYSSTGTIPSISIVLSGLTNGITNVVETVAISGTNSALTNYWSGITNISAPTSGVAWGDAITVQYTNGIDDYHSLPELNASAFNQRQKVLNALRWMASDGEFYTVRHYWYGNSGIDHATAIANAMNNAIGGPSAPACWETGTNYVLTNAPYSIQSPGGYAYSCENIYYDPRFYYGGTHTDFTVEAWSSESFPVAKPFYGYDGLATNYGHGVDFYWYYAPLGGVDVFTNMGAANVDLTKTNYFLTDSTFSIASTHDYPATGTVSIGTTAFPTAEMPDTTIAGGVVSAFWTCALSTNPPDPGEAWFTANWGGPHASVSFYFDVGGPVSYVTTNACKGWTTASQHFPALLKFDVDGGFKFK